jgi:hypothetical protein
MLPAVNDEFGLPEAIQWLMQVTKSAGLPGIKPKRVTTEPTVTIAQTFKSSQTLGIKYKRYNLMLAGLVAQFELTAGWASLPRSFIGQHVFINTNYQIRVTLTHVIGTGKFPNEEFEINVTDLKPKVTPIY